MAINKFEKLKNLHMAFCEFSESFKGVSLNTFDYLKLKNTEGFNDFFIIITDLNGIEYWNDKIIVHSKLVPQGKFYLL